MQCQHCHVDRQGRNYEFILANGGITNFEESHSPGMGSVYTSTYRYRIEGKGEEFICDNCVSRQRSKFFCYGLPFLVCVSLVIFFPSVRALLFATGPGIPGTVVLYVSFLASLYIWYYSIKYLSFGEAGNQIAIKAARAHKENKYEGYQYLFTPKQVRNMKPTS
jgi:hypothetical protein